MKEHTKECMRIAATIMAIIITIILIAFIAVMPAYGQQQTVIKNSAGEVMYVKVKTNDGYIIKDKNGILLYRIVETEKEKRTYDAAGRLISIEKKNK